jgi:translocation and assembly module TamA
MLVCFAVVGAGEAWADVPYDPAIKLEGLDDDKLLDSLKDISQLVALKKKVPETRAALQRRIEDDVQRLVSVMEAAGYWQAQIDDTVDADKSPAMVTVTVKPGPLFHVAKIIFQLPSGAPAELPDTLGAKSLGLAVGDPAKSSVVAAVDGKIINAYGQRGQPFARTDRHAVIDVATATMDVTYIIDPGPRARFGKVTIDGLKSLNRTVVERRIGWREGALFDTREVEKTRQSLVTSGLFSAVEIKHRDAPDPDGTIPLTFALTEAPHHSVGAGVGYNTNYRAGVRGFWEDRNLFGNAETLRLSAGVAQRQIGAAANFRRPDIWWNGLDFVSNVELLRQETDAYNSRRASAYAGFEERSYAPYVFGGGLLLEQAKLTTDEPGRDEDYLLLGLPLYARRDTTDNLLDPTKGSRASLTLTPYHSLMESGPGGKDVNFVSSRLQASLYQQLGPTDRWILAGYGAIGSIVGAGLDAIPLDKRLYAGGAGSVRGFGYQLAGPLDSYDKPTGGRSSLELGGEVRYRITETIGIVPFVDAGNVYSAVLPNSAQLFYSAGIGLRYYTAIGPVRVDVAAPLNKRSTDGPVQFYVSLGQAF